MNEHEASDYREIFFMGNASQFVGKNRKRKESKKSDKGNVMKSVCKTLIEVSPCRMQNVTGRDDYLSGAIKKRLSEMLNTRS
ncbi:TPA: hypothetical protein ACIEMZ_004242 [Escherichia coli]|uniref:hypothetical protein n=1 Tax=Escherichia coli TaxID=562 RepID=UPI001372963C|nr:hypothetical protein [Escherichia coli]HAG5789606.1 hypothetical protein [Escherichia coli]